LRERAVFEAFAVSAGLPIVAGSAGTRPPPEPDILCQLEREGFVAFELVELIDQELARATSTAAAQVLWVDDPTLDSIRKKLRKQYETPHPVELLAYGGAETLPDDVWEARFAQRLRDLVDEAQFRRLWVFSLPQRNRQGRVRFVHPASVFATDSR
jgi:hypothetical protein